MSIPQTYNGKSLIHIWTYCAKEGAPFGVVGRYEDENGNKDVVPFFKPNGSGFAAGIDLNPRPLYGLKKLAAHPKNKAAFIVEGEKCAAALHSLNICAVSSLGGANNADKADWTPLDSYKMVYILPDNDEAGQTYAQAVYRQLSALNSPPDVKVLILPNLPDGGDVVDWLQSLIANWDGYKPIDKSLHEAFKEELQTELKKAEPVPENWNLAGLAGSCPSVFEWQSPNEIESKTPPVQALQSDILPEPLRACLADVSHRMQTPPDFAAISSIVIMGSLIGAGCGIRPKQFDDWEVIPNLWGACIAPPSMLKTPSMKEPMQMLERLQAEYGKQFEQNKKGFDFDKEVNNSVKKSLKAELDKVTKKEVIDPIEIAALRGNFMELDETPEPARRMFKTNETSIQSMPIRLLNIVTFPCILL